MKIFYIFADALNEYCKEHNLDFSKVISSPKCGNEMALLIQHIGNKTNGLNVNEPAEILLSAIKDDKGVINITQYDGANKYLKA